MSELITTRRSDFRWQLLSTVSAVTLLGCALSHARAEDADRPTVWVELGAQVERVDSGQQGFVPPFLADSPRADVWDPAPASVERPGRYAIGGEGKITFAPEGTDWVFSAAVRYGRSHRNKSIQQQSAVPTLVPLAFTNPELVTALPKLYDDANATSRSSHAILDFMAGKDVGLGIFGGDSTIKFGVRYAQFNSQANGTLKSRPTLGHIQSAFGGIVNYYYPHNYKADFSNRRSFSGIGPSIEWDGSSNVAGSKDAGHLTFDWGVNAAVLFGRQKARVQHNTSGNYVQMSRFTKYNIISSYHSPHATARSRSVVVPNVGGFAGVSFAFPNAKISMGYRADVFFGAMDGGLDSRKTYNQSFYGPFATISIGLGG